MNRRQEKVLVTQGAPAPLSTCTHHWVIETPSGPVSRGKCKLCNEDGEFKNYLDNTPYWEDDVSLDQVSSGARFRADAPTAEPDDSVEG